MSERENKQNEKDSEGREYDFDHNMCVLLPSTGWIPGFGAFSDNIDMNI